jgi:NADPH-dependent 2,4-dienoyl-CoA reductase/sulfur reductase-like enzyme/rhodanese-related sulfurtransferase
VTQSQSAVPQRIVIVGGVAGGASAATRARRLDEHAIITLFEKDEHVSFANCGLPYYIGGEIEKREDLLVVKPELFERRFRVNVRTRQEVVGIDRARKRVRVRNHVSGTEYEEPYDKLVLAPGAAPIVPPNVPRAENIFTLRNLADTDRVREFITRATPPGGRKLQAIIVGAGYVGLEMVEQLLNVGLETTLIELVDQVLPLLDPEMGNQLEGELEKHGVRVFAGDSIEAFESEGDRVVRVTLKSGRRLDVDVVVLGIGVKPNSKLAADAGLELGEGGGICTNDFAQTSDPDIYAAGDAAEYHYGPLGKRARVPLAGPANRAGRMAGEHAARGASRVALAPVQGTSIVRVFGKVAAMTGLTQKMARRSGRATESVVIVANDHASYYPGAEQMVLKLVFELATGKVLGAQAVGGDGIDKRMDVIATVIHFGGTVRDLAGLDLAYAPPFGAAKDPVHVAAFAACNVLDGYVRLANPDLDLRDKQVVDVRTPREIANESIPSCDQSIAIPVDELRERLGELDPTKPTVVVCATGRRSYLAARVLEQRGFADVQSLSGGVLLRKTACRTPGGHCLCEA